MSGLKGHKINYMLRKIRIHDRLADDHGDVPEYLTGWFHKFVRIRVTREITINGQRQTVLVDEVRAIIEYDGGKPDCVPIHKIQFESPPPPL